MEILPMKPFQKGWGHSCPLGGGLLSGKYSLSEKPTSGRLMSNAMYNKRYREDSYYEIAEQFSAFALKQGIHPATLAVAWVASHPAITAPILGARNVEQLEPSLAAAYFNYDPRLKG
ncbi:MAG: aldo/keto reductase [Deinococcales bacterium]